MFEKKLCNKEIFDISSDISKRRPLLFNNFYGIDDPNGCEVEVLNNTVLIRKKEFDFYRLFIISNDEKELQSALLSLTDKTYAINIPSKRPIDNWDLLLKSCGFTFLDVYSRYYNNNIKSFPTSIDTFANETELDDIANLLYDNFSLCTDHLPEKDELSKMIANKQVITDYKNGKVCGVLIYTISGNKGYQNAWIDFGDNALGLLFRVKSIFIEHGIKYCYYWIKDSNVQVIKIHTMMGGKPDGLKDYNYRKSI